MKTYRLFLSIIALFGVMFTSVNAFAEAEPIRISLNADNLEWVKWNGSSNKTTAWGSQLKTIYGPPIYITHTNNNMSFWNGTDLQFYALVGSSHPQNYVIGVEEGYKILEVGCDFIVGTHPTVTHSIAEYGVSLSINGEEAVVSTVSKADYETGTGTPSHAEAKDISEDGNVTEVSLSVDFVADEALNGQDNALFVNAIGLYVIIEPLEGMEKAIIDLQAAFNKYNVVDQFVEGTEPGCYPKALVSDLNTALIRADYDELEFSGELDGMTEDDIRARITDLENAYNALVAAKIPITLPDGYYRIRTRTMYTNTINTGEVDGNSQPITRDESMYKYIRNVIGENEITSRWQNRTDKADDEALMLFQLTNKDGFVDLMNVATETRFNDISASGTIVSSQEADGLLYIDAYETADNETSVFIRMAEKKDENNSLHQSGHGGGTGVSGTLVGWYAVVSNEAQPASLWVFEPVSDADAQAIMEAYIPVKERNEMLVEYHKIYDDAASKIEVAKDPIIGENGLITSADQLSSPWTESSEGSLAALIDGNTETFWQSQWSAGTVANHTHYLQVVLPEVEYNELIMKITRRAASNDHITLCGVWGCNDAEAEDDAWVNLASLPMPYGNYSETIISKTFKTQGYKFLRFYIDGTTTGRGYGHASEFQLFEAFPNPNSQYAKLGEISKNLDTILNDLRNKNETDITYEDYQALSKAYERFNNAGNNSDPAIMVSSIPENDSFELLSASLTKISVTYDKTLNLSSASATLSKDGVDTNLTNAMSLSEDGKTINIAVSNLADGEYTLTLSGVANSYEVPCDKDQVLTFSVGKDNDTSISEVVYSTNETFANTPNGTFPVGWMSNENGTIHKYGFNENGSLFNYNWGGNPGGGGCRIMTGYSGDLNGGALYWRSMNGANVMLTYGEQVKDYIMEDGTINPQMPASIALQLDARKYQITIRMCAWRNLNGNTDAVSPENAPKYSFTLEDLEGNVYARFDDVIAMPNVNGAQNVAVTNVTRSVTDFTVDKAGYYMLKFSTTQPNSDFLLGGVDIITMPSKAAYWKQQLAAAVEQAEPILEAADLEEYDGETKTAFTAAINSAKNGHFTAPSEIQALINQLSVLGTAMQARVTNIDAFNQALEDADLAYLGLEGKYLDAEIAVTAKEMLDTYKNTNPSELSDEALAEITPKLVTAAAQLSNVTTVVDILTYGGYKASQTAETLGADGSAALGLTTDDRNVVNSVNAGSTLALYQMLAESPVIADSLKTTVNYDAGTKIVVDGVYTDMSGEEVAASGIDFTGLIQNPRFYTFTTDGSADLQDNTVVGWNCEQLEGGHVHLANGASATEAQPVITSAINAYAGGAEYRFYQVIENVPVGVYDVYFATRTASMSNAMDYETGIWDKYIFAQVGDNNPIMVPFAAGSSWFGHPTVIPGVTVKKGQKLTIGAVEHYISGEASATDCWPINTFVGEARLYFAAPLEDYDYAAAAIEVQNEINKNRPTDVTDIYIRNAHFIEGDPLNGGVCRYDYDIETHQNKGALYFGMQPVDSWIPSTPNDNARASGLFAVGSPETIWLGSPDYSVPAKKADGATEGNMLGVVSIWSASSSYTQNVTLPAGTYTITIPTYNGGGTGTIAKNLCGFISADGDEYLAQTTSFPVGEWKEETIRFTLEEETAGVISIGYQAANAGSGSMPHLWIDGVILKVRNKTTSSDTYKLTYLVDGSEYKSLLIKEGQAITPELAPTKDGYTFGGWSEIPSTMPTHDVEVTGRFYLYGDVNTDEEVDVVDVVDIARFVVATPSEKFREKLADLNNDETVNIGDAVVLVNHIAGDQNFVKPMFAPSTYADYNATLHLNQNDKSLSLYLDNGRDYTAFQFDLYVSENADVSQMKLNAKRKQTHQMLYNKVGIGHYRVAVISLTNDKLNDDDGELLSFVINGETGPGTSIQNIRFFDTKGTAYLFDAIGIDVETGVESIHNLQCPTHNYTDDVYDLTGRKLTKAQRGVNIVNGKAIIVK